MYVNNTHKANGYTFFITTVRLLDGRYRGRIWVSPQYDNGVVCAPPVSIDTPGALKSIQAIKAEAFAYAQELMQSGALSSVLDAHMEDATRKNYPY